jgi:hypothetical protein
MTEDNFEVVYDAFPIEESLSVPTIVYPEEGKKTDLELMVVDAAFRCKPTPRALDFLRKIRAHFHNRVGELLTYKEIKAFCIEDGFIPKGYKHNAWPCLTKWLDMLWKAGKIKKYRKGYRATRSKTGVGLNEGVAYWIWEGLDE